MLKKTQLSIFNGVEMLTEHDKVYSINQLSQMGLGVSGHTLRYWANNNILKPTMSLNKNHKYSLAAIEKAKILSVGLANKRHETINDIFNRVGI